MSSYAFSIAVFAIFMLFSAFLLDNFIFLRYNTSMRHIFREYFSKNGIRFHHSISTYDNDNQDTLSPESHHMCEIILLLNGSVTYKIEGQTYDLSPLDVIIIHPNKLHSREINPEVPYERMVLHFSPDLLPSFADLYLLSNPNNSFVSYVLPKKIIEKTNLLSLMQQCEDLCLPLDKYTDLRFISIILQVVETLNEIILMLDEENAAPPIQIDKISYACIQYINEYLTEKDKLSPANIAKELHISVSHLQHTFKKEIGVSLHTYISNQRIQLARKLLLQGESPQVVANRLNYEYYSTFYHNFLKRFGATPHSFTQIQQKNQKDINI